MADRFEWKVTSDVDYKKIEAPNNIRLLIGFPEGMPHKLGGPGQLEDGMIDTAELVKMLYFGVPWGIITPLGTHGMPPRPFLTDGMEYHMMEIRQGKDGIKDYYQEVLKTRKYKIAKRLGARIVGYVKRYVVDDHYSGDKPNSPTTRAYKITRKVADRKSKFTAIGKTTPLIDTGAMIGSMTFIVQGWVES